LGLAIITYIYWPIDYTPTPSFVKVFEVVRTTYMYWPIDCIPKLSFVKVFEFARISFI
jgi:hypothetical protein